MSSKDDDAPPPLTEEGDDSAVVLVQEEKAKESTAAASSSAEDTSTVVDTIDTAKTSDGKESNNNHSNDAARNDEAEDPTSVPSTPTSEGQGVVMTHLVVLPPRQQPPSSQSQKTQTPPDTPLQFPPLRSDEHVQALRLALGEVVGYAHLTNFRLEVEQETPSASDFGVNSTATAVATSSPSSPPLVSPYTGPHAVVSAPISWRSLQQAPLVVTGNTASAPSSTVVLDDFGDLSALVPLVKDSTATTDSTTSTTPTPTTIALRMVLEAYDVASIKDHVARLRQLLAGQPPSLHSLGEETRMEATTVVPPPPPRDPLALPENMDEQLPVDSTDLQHFFYRVTGEDPTRYEAEATVNNNHNHNSHNHTTTSSPTGKSKKKKKKAGNAAANATATEDGIPAPPTTMSTTTSSPPQTYEAWIQLQAQRLNELEQALQVPCIIQYSGFHPPPSARQLMGDLAYLEVTLPSEKDSGTTTTAQTIFVTATTLGFYVNKSTKLRFDPSPAQPSYHSHALLDCLLQTSPTLQTAWTQSLAAVRERTVLLNQGSLSSVQSLFRLAIRGDVPPTGPEGVFDPAPTLDAHMGTPTWLVPTPTRVDHDNASSPSSAALAPTHSYNALRTEEDLTYHYGVDLRSGAPRDWNDEIQLAREMPTSTLPERVERARLLHKIWSEFGAAALAGVHAVTQGLVMPMNPNEGIRTQVFLHNNIFISRALDMGPDTFRLIAGDGAARKSVGREIQCLKALQRLDSKGDENLCTLGTVLVEYRGQRFMCQSVLPGILSGEKSHRVVLGSVETGSSLNWDADVHGMLQESVGELLHLRSGPIYASPLTQERRDQVQAAKALQPSQVPAALAIDKDDRKDEKDKMDDDAVLTTCAPIESKVILGSDQRKYVLDFTRMTSRDANWVPQSQGGTGRWEEVQKTHGTTRFVPTTLEDDEWVAHVLRPELLRGWLRRELDKARIAKRESARKEKEESANEPQHGDKPEDNDDKNKTDKEKKDDKESAVDLSEEEQKEIMDRLRLNVNVFLPHVRSADEEQTKQDEDSARTVAAFLWDEVLPNLTRSIRHRSSQSIPLDGKSLTEMLHRTGINCRYLGRLALLAQDEEQKDQKFDEDIKKHRIAMLERMTMPKCWLEMLECEMVARAAKHVLDTYLSEHCAVASWAPAQTVASFLSALVSEREESAAETEIRLEKATDSQLDDDEVQTLTQVDVGGDGDGVPMASRSRSEIWQDVEHEVARRFRYSLHLLNKPGNARGRAMCVPLLRRVCQRCGIRLAAKSYKVGGACYTSGNSSGGRLTATYPISPLDVVDVVPLIKHAAAYNEGFEMCTFGPSTPTQPPLQVSLIDATLALERAHIQFGTRSLGHAMELVQEAVSLYQRVTESTAHPGVIECVELMASIFFDAGDADSAADHCQKALGLAVQGNGFDNVTVHNFHLLLFRVYFVTKDLDKCVKHLRAAAYILGLMGGPNHYEMSNIYLKLFATYKQDDIKSKYNQTAVDVYRVLNEFDPADRVVAGLGERRFAEALAEAGQYKEAIEFEKRAYSRFSNLVGANHELVKACDETLKKYTNLAVEQGKGAQENEKLKHEAEFADNVAAELVAMEESKTTKKKGKKKKGKK